MREVLMSIQPKWCADIANLKKPIEVRKTKPNLQTPFKVCIYATQPKKWFRYSSFGYASEESLWLVNGKVKMSNGFEFWGNGEKCECLNGKVIGEFICDEIEEFTEAFFDEQEPRDTEEIRYYLDQFNMSYSELYAYVGSKNFYGWHISQFKIYDKPKELSEFFHACKQPNGTDCSKCIDRKEKTCYSLKRPPQSWCYAEEV